MVLRFILSMIFVAVAAVASSVVVSLSGVLLLPFIVIAISMTVCVLVQVIFLTSSFQS